MKYITTIILVILTVVMGIFAAVHKEPKKKPAGDDKRVFDGFQPNQASAVVWKRGKSKVRVEKKDDGRWMIVEPLEFPADADAVEALLTDFETLVYSRKIQKNVKRAEFNLSPPKATVIVEGGLPGGKEAVLHMGGRDLTERHVYVARGNKKEALLVGEHVGNTLDRDLDDLRSKKVLMFKYEEVSGLDIQRDEKNKVKIKKSGEDYLLVGEDGSVRVRGQRETIESIMRKLETLKMSRFAASGENVLAKHGLQQVARRVIVFAGEKEKHELFIGGKCEVEGKTYEGELLAGRKYPSPAVFCLKVSELRHILRRPEELRDIKLVDLTADGLEKITIESKGESLILSKEGETWLIGDSDGKGKQEKESREKSDSVLIARFLDEIRAFSILGFAFPTSESLGDYGLESPKASISFKGVDGGEVVLLMGSTTEKHLYVQRKGERGVLMVHKELSSRFQPDRLAFRDRKVLDFDSMDVKKIEAERVGVVEVLEKKGGMWKLVKPEELRADGEIVDTLLRVTGGLKAERYVSQTARPEHGFSAGGSHKLSFELESTPRFGADGKKEEGAGKKVTHELEIGPAVQELGGRCFGRLLTGDKAVFRLDKLVCSDLTSFLADRGLIDITATAVKGVSFRGPKVTEELEKRGPQWYRSAGPKIDNIKVENLLGALTALRAREVLGYMEPQDSHGVRKPHIEITVEDEKGKKKSLFVGNQEKTGDEDGGRYCWVGGRKVIYSLSEADVKKLQDVVF